MAKEKRPAVCGAFFFYLQLEVAIKQRRFFAALRFFVFFTAFFAAYAFCHDEYELCMVADKSTRLHAKINFHAQTSLDSIISKKLM